MLEMVYHCVVYVIFILSNNYNNNNNKLSATKDINFNEFLLLPALALYWCVQPKLK